jgi:inorganic pyrophosphatase
MNLWQDVPSERISPDKFLAVIEIPKGSKCKYEMDKELGILRLDRVLYTSTAYPHNYGFIPKTLAKDGDPMDVLVLCSETMFPLSIVEAYPIGVMMMKDGNDEDEKIIAVAATDPFYSDYKDISELPDHILKEIVHFFTVYKQLENKFTNVENIYGSTVAKQIIAASIKEY